MGEGTKIRKAVEGGVGKMVVTHLAKIVVGLGALLALVWNLRGDISEREHRLKAVEDKVQQIERKLRRTERALWRMGIRTAPPTVKPLGKEDSL